MHRSNKSAFFNIYYLIIDIVSILTAYYISYCIALRFVSLNSIKEYSWLLLVYIPIWVFTMYVTGMYNNTTFKYYDRIFIYGLCSSVFSSGFVVAIMYAIRQSMYSKLLCFIFFLVTFIVTLIEKYVVLFKIKIRNENNTKQVIVIGFQSMYDQFDYYISKTNLKPNIVKHFFIDENRSDFMKSEYLEQSLKQHVVDEIIFLIPSNYVDNIQEYASLCEEMGITVRLVLDILDTKLSRVYVASLGTLPMITFHTVNLNSIQLFIKRVIDIIGALGGLALSSIIWIIVAILIKLDSPGPAIFVQNRVGQNGRIFKLYKFRSMYVDADEKKEEILEQNEHKDDLMFKMKNDPRVTRVGSFIRKTSIDELPQFINVLKGDMSLVGTRPPTVNEVELYENYHRRRISIKPGITGMWQVSGRSAIKDFDKVVELDTKYIDEWSIGLDLKIMMKTFLVVFSKKDAY